jgi:hypothetical protein
LDEIPGYQHIPEVLDRSRQSFMEKVPLQGSEAEIGMFISSFNTLIISFLGACSCQAQVLGMDSDSASYRQWVKDTLMFMLLPGLKSLIRPGAPRKAV